MCGYQGWFRAEGDDVGRGWGHFGNRDKFDPDNITIDLWPDMSEYEKTYPTDFINADSSVAHIFSSVDSTTTNLHFKWMKDYSIDGVFMQRFFGVGRNERTRRVPDMVLKNGLDASQVHERAIAVMYDLSGLNPEKDDCSVIIEDWKHLVDDLNVTNYGKKQTYLHHNNKPLVAIWGIGFPDRPYDIHEIGIDSLIDFLKNDPVYGGCSVMLGVPTYFRELGRDCVKDSFLHETIRSADLVMPWMVGRFDFSETSQIELYRKHVEKDVKWCSDNNVDYVPCVFPGFSWYNLSKVEFGEHHKMNAIPRLGGSFYLNQIINSIEVGASMFYVAMFDEIDEATAIFKCTNNPPVNASFINYEGLPSDHYLRLTGKTGKVLKKEISLDELKDELN